MNSNVENMFSYQISAPGNNRHALLPDPFCDFASTSMPRSKSDVLRLCEHVWLMSGQFKTAMQSVVRYFLTKVEILGEVSDSEREKYLDFLNNVLDIMAQAANVGDDFLCFHGDVTTTTDKGVFTLRELAGRTVNVLSKGGVYRPARFKSFGRQRLLEVLFSDGSTLKATPEHLWIVKNMSGKLVELPTSKLLRGHRIPRTVAPRPEKNEEYREGVRHGFVFGDGSLYNGGRQGVANFFGDKASALLPFFSECSTPRHYPDQELYKVHGLPPEYKQLPENEKSASYWYGFICGFLAADGSVDTHGCALLTQTKKDVLDSIVKQLTRVGMVAGPVRGYERTATIKQAAGSSTRYTSDMYYVSLLKQFMEPGDFIRPEHREKFLHKFKKTSYGEYISVVSVRDTGVTDEVFCCVEDETHTFVVGNAVLTKQCYGNSFSSFYMPFNRVLICKECGFSISIDQVDKFKLDKKNKTFNCFCYRCQKSTEHDHKDLRSMDEKRIHLIRWNPHEIELKHNFISGETTYVWRINEQFKRMIRDGNTFWIRNTPWEIVEAAIDGEMFEFNKNCIHHLMEPTIAGVHNRGWGIPRLFGAFKDVYYVQMLKRYNEALALDYIVPFRVITPAKAGVADPLMHHDMNQWVTNLNQLLEDHRRNPTGYHTVPFPVSYQALSGEGVQLSPFQLIKQGNADLMSAIGVPLELFQGTMSLQAAPTALRLFQATWPHLIYQMNGWLTWVVTTIGNFFGWEEIRARLQPVTYADDLERKSMLIQMQMANQISKQTAYGFLGIDPKEEARRMMDEQRDQIEIQREFEEDQVTADELRQMSEQSASAGAQGGAGMGMGAPMGGMPGAPGMPAPQPVAGMGVPLLAQPGAGATTPEDLMNQAQGMAQQLLGLDETTRKSSLIQLKRTNPMLHAQVRQIMKNYEQQASTQGVAAMRQQMAQPQ